MVLDAGEETRFAAVLKLKRAPKLKENTES